MNYNNQYIYDLISHKIIIKNILFYVWIEVSLHNNTTDSRFTDAGVFSSSLEVECKPRLHTVVMISVSPTVSVRKISGSFTDHEEYHVEYFPFKNYQWNR